MGMAASQARLLSITARLHDVEFEAQSIMSKKLALATQKDELYAKYNAALDATKIQISLNGGSDSFVDATFENVCSFNPNRTINYALTDANSGKMLVEQDIFDAYKSFQGGDKYAFALQMLGFDEDDTSKLLFPLVGVVAGSSGEPTEEAADPDAFNEDTVSGAFKDSKTGKYTRYLLMTAEENAVYQNHADDSDLVAAMNKFEQAKEKGDKKEVEKAIDNFRTKLYSKYAGEIYGGVCKTLDTEAIGEFDSEMAAEFQYYVQLFEGIESMGGCVSVGDYAKDGDTGNDWFNNAVQSGRVILNQYVTSGTKKGWNEISIATSTNAQEVHDKTEEKKAEAEYEYELGKINRKDTKYDQDLNKLETERSALNKEMESVKKVKDENIERTFGIFS